MRNEVCKDKIFICILNLTKKRHKDDQELKQRKQIQMREESGNAWDGRRWFGGGGGEISFQISYGRIWL